jgi:hypothetical protein
LRNELNTEFTSLLSKILFHVSKFSLYGKLRTEYVSILLMILKLEFRIFMSISPNLISCASWSDKSLYKGDTTLFGNLEVSIKILSNAVADLF